MIFKDRVARLKRHSAGIGLIEVLVAVAISGIMLTGIAMVLTQSVRNSAEARMREVATAKSQHVMEYLQRSRAVYGWQAFSDELPESQTICLTDDGSLQEDAFINWTSPFGQQAYTCSFLMDDDLRAEFTRELEVEENTGSTITVLVTTTWRIGTQEREVTLRREFAQY
ncbi:MAG: prepilin-type N-terminal cleavage/methylation domain-containing protein [Pseudomonadales bacterium]|nr:prepilin-type N-terminal cleavage/methylation domain-containing protein [Candidatus Woesebacteria bacterium]MCB9802310.1 prepilin-type N-terminal cleavage/methylation domain-containing protein [Pseudomonadales bacterium]